MSGIMGLVIMIAMNMAAIPSPSRITNGKINDFPVFNIADSCISVAMVMLLLTWSKQSEIVKVDPAIGQEPMLEEKSV